MIKQYSAGGVIIRKVKEAVKVLLIRDRFGSWTWPKGHLEEGETPQEAALREISEEVGINNTTILGEAGIQKYSFKYEGQPIDKEVNVYAVEAKGCEKIKVQTEEINHAEWMSSGEAIKKIQYKGAKEILKKALDIYGQKS